MRLCSAPGETNSNLCKSKSGKPRPVTVTTLRNPCTVLENNCARAGEAADGRLPGHSQHLEQGFGLSNVWMLGFRPGIPDFLCYYKARDDALVCSRLAAVVTKSEDSTCMPVVVACCNEQKPEGHGSWRELDRPSRSKLPCQTVTETAPARREQHMRVWIWRLRCADRLRRSGCGFWKWVAPPNEQMNFLSWLILSPRLL